MKFIFAFHPLAKFLYIIYNEKSGKVKSDSIISDFHRIVEEYGYSLDVYITERL